MTVNDLRPQYEEAKASGVLADLVSTANEWNVSPQLVVAVASREANLRNEIGDGGHGVGVMQIDTRWHYAAGQMLARDTWQTPRGRLVLVRIGVKILLANYRLAHSQVADVQDAWRVAVAGYNCGMRSALYHHLSGDCDAMTTGHNYSADVFGRVPVFESLLREDRLI